MAFVALMNFSSLGRYSCLTSQSMIPGPLIRVTYVAVNRPHRDPDELQVIEP